MPDAVVIGAGPNGLVAANVLADHGWEVLVLEEQDEPGGAVRSAELVEPGFVNDRFSSFYPLVAASPHFRALRLEEHGVRWRRSAAVLAHPTPDGPCAVLEDDVDATARSLGAIAAGDGDAWRSLYGLFERSAEAIAAIALRPFPPLWPAAALVARQRLAGVARLARLALTPVRRLGEEEFSGSGGRLLLAGNALHADLAPEAPPSGAYGWFLTCLGQRFGFPVPEGGAGRLTEALVARLRARGGRVECGRRVVRIDVRGGRAVAVATGDGDCVAARRAVLADVGAPQLYRELLPPDRLPGRVRRWIGRFEYDSATFKLDWTLDGPIPWTAAEARRAGTVHVSPSVNALSRYAAEIAQRRAPSEPFLVLGQYASFDPTRAPAGKETAWAYTHLPRGPCEQVVPEAFADRMEEQVERAAPGFRTLIRGRHITTPHDLEQADRNLVGGAINGGTAQLHQQLVFRPVPGLARPETPIGGLYLASASAHPGGGVHGACGANAARAALKRSAVSSLRRRPLATRP